MEEQQKKIAISSDHAGFELKENLKDFFKMKGIEVVDLGPETEDRISYATQGLKLAHYVKEHEEDTLGIAVCGTGIGISMAVNRVKGIRGARITSIKDAKMAKEHNNANIIVIGGRITTTKKAVDMYKTFTRARFEGGRHIERLEQMDMDEE